MRFGRRARLRRLKDSTLLAIGMIALLSIGTATAARLISGGEIAKHTITGRNVKLHSLSLSDLKSPAAGPAGPPGPSGAKGEPGQKGDRGLTGSEGPVGPAAITELAPLNSPVAAEIAPDAQFAFVGNPATVLVGEGGSGTATASVTIGSTEATIDDELDFALTVCASVEGAPIVPLETEEEEKTGKVGISPTLTLNQRTAVPLASGFAVNGEFEGLAEVEVGPCLMNATATKLNDNGRVIGDVIVASA